MKLPFVDKVAKKFTKTASEEVKKEAKKTAVNMLPGLLALGGMILGIVVFRETKEPRNNHTTTPRPFSSTTHITTNNYFLGDVSEDIIKKVLEEKQ